MEYRVYGIYGVYGVYRVFLGFIEFRVLSSPLLRGCCPGT